MHIPLRRNCSSQSRSHMTSTTHNSPNMSQVYNLDIVGAFYGNMDVTSKVRQLYIDAATSNPNNNSFSITPSNTLFGKDPLPDSYKTCIVVWRAMLPLSTSVTPLRRPALQYLPSLGRRREYRSHNQLRRIRSQPVYAHLHL
ncbi:uncharacterized protein LAESUDRAFT_242142 [Laetiporus sulphureus 93-53]|uniref:Uncharacterized protein n=1 Tax=Laetiporus sulphureus 93-53 TaxID=1314785 RepID=A0A165DKT1_9APHY|nr:uncharacterized protein LAESUDRAFT_242142 [Laetiporus sulphureus 93-53]KZT05103.1 hypothetical protein LAESUDRAFT_242142 [Laetiporus sulphureus 93-53]